MNVSHYNCDIMIMIIIVHDKVSIVSQKEALKIGTERMLIVEQCRLYDFELFCSNACKLLKQKLKVNCIHDCLCSLI